MIALPRNIILTGDAAEQLGSLPEASVDCIVTSPPYYNVRNYGVDGQLGQESDVTGWVEELRVVCGGLARVLKPHGVLWLNLGDSFSRHRQYGAPPKSLLLGPERLVLALMRDGWIVRGKIVWTKTNPTPSSVTDRPSMTWEIVYMLVRAPRYYFDLDSIREPHKSQPSAQRKTSKLGTADWAGPLAASRGGLSRMKASGQVGHPLGKNPGDSWREATSGYRGAHFATFPPSLVRRPILATCPPVVCTDCGRPRVHTSARVAVRCSCPAATPTRPGVVLDPFYGAGTVGVAAEDFGRDWLGIELNPAYVALAEARIQTARRKRATA